MYDDKICFNEFNNEDKLSNYNFQEAIFGGLIGFYIGDFIGNIIFNESKNYDLLELLKPTATTASYMAVVTASMFSAVTQTYLDSVQNGIVVVGLSLILSYYYAEYLTNEEHENLYEIFIDTIQDIIAIALILMIVFNIEDRGLLNTELSSVTTNSEYRITFTSFIFLGLYQMAKKYINF